jgi:hypothetical protein
VTERPDAIGKHPASYEELALAHGYAKPTGLPALVDVVCRPK